MKHINMKHTDKKIKNITAVVLTGALIAAPCTALAASPEFARTAEEWATLQDNVLEYGEIEDLVHEYNPTVQKNQIELEKFRRDYGMTNSEWADRYRELANELEDDLNYPDIDDTSYATIMSSIVTSEMQIETWRETADDALEDYEVYYLTYMQEEKQIAQNAQDDMIAYYADQVALQSDLTNREILEVSYEDAVARQSLGSATYTTVLLAEQDLQDNAEAIQQDETAIESAKENLLVELGWSYSSDPEIMPLPPLDFEHIATMNPDIDREQAIANNYTLRINQRKYDNARAQDNIDSLAKTIASNEQMIGASLNSLYSAVLSAQAAYELAQSEYELEVRDLSSAERQYSLGNISRIEYLTQQNTTQMKEIAVQSAYLSLFQAVQNYDWAVKGLANA